MNFYLGIDFGTSGLRGIVIDENQSIQVEKQCAFSHSSDAQTTSSWRRYLFDLINQIPVEVRRKIRAIAINGTSSTVLLCDRAGDPICNPIMYNDARGAKVLDKLKSLVPQNHTVISATSSLAKLLCLKEAFPQPNDYYFLHQADWLAFLLHGRLGISDYHNALKLGYDIRSLCYPDWLESLEIPFQLPKIIPPGTPISQVKPELATAFEFPQDCLVCAGTTDSIAAFLASGANSPGEAVTSLGSTLAIKLLSNTFVEDSQYGIYSHRLGDLWLVGGASNTGGAVLRHFFNDAELIDLSQKIEVGKESPLDYYPLLKIGDRFPINDPNLQPRLEPRPPTNVEFLHGLLQGIARIEATGYQLLQQLGSTSLSRVYTAGGGAKNSVWTAIRGRYLNVPMLQSLHSEAAYGTALLAMRSNLEGLT